MNKEEIDLLEIVFTLAIGECAYNDINNIQKLEDKIKTINNLCKKQKEVIDKLNNKINSLITCKDKPKEDIIYPHWEICNETKQEMLYILKDVDLLIPERK